MAFPSFLSPEYKQVSCFLSSVFVAVFMLSLISCNEKLSVVGNTFPPDTLQLTSVITTDSQPLVATSVPFAQSSSLSGFGVVYIGKTPTVEAITLSRLVIPDTLPTIPAENIMSATLEITPTRPLYAFGDTASNQLSFSVVKVKKLWSPRATLDSITPAADYFDNSALATFTGKIDLKDSTGSIKINFDKSQIAEWISLRNQYKNDTLNYGIAFIPTSGLSVIRRFSSGAVGSTSTKQFATVTVTYKKSLTDAKEDTVLLISGYDGTFFSTPSPGNSDKSIALQGAVAIKSRVSFDVRVIPKGVAIHLAGLTLTLDPSRSVFGTSGMDSVIYADFIDSSANNLLRSYYGSRLKDASGKFTDEFYFPTLNSAIEGIVRRSGTGSVTIQTRPDQFYLRTDKMVFFGPEEPDKSKRPRLTVIYSTRPKF
jgi:hypothetical protein